jgi:RNA-directed DNA polymerase
MVIGATRVENEGLPERPRNLYSLAKLESVLGVRREQLRFIARLAGSYYRPFHKRERQRPFSKKSSAPRKKPRIIDNPQDPLKAIQRSIHRNLLLTVQLPDYICGGVPGKTVLDNVYMHLGASTLITIDIKNFFREITNVQVYEVWRKLLGCGPKIAGLLTQLTSFERHLPQGAPTSTILANLVLYRPFESVRNACARHGITYSTWIDDLAFSGDDSRKIIPLVVAALHSAGFSISHRKLKTMGPATRKRLNGIVMSRFPNVAREYEKRIRSGIHKIQTHQIMAQDLEKYLRQLKGAINYVSLIAPRKGERFRRELLKIGA